MMKVCRKSDRAHRVETLPSVQKGAHAAFVPIESQLKRVETLVAIGVFTHITKQLVIKSFETIM